MSVFGRKYWVKSGIFIGDCFIWKLDWGYRGKVIYCILCSRWCCIGIFYFINWVIKFEKIEVWGKIDLIIS